MKLWVGENQMVKYNKIKYKTGDKVYSYQNPKEANKFLKWLDKTEMD